MTLRRSITPNVSTCHGRSHRITPSAAAERTSAWVCLGNALARLELRVLFEELMRRVPDMQIAGPITRLTSNFSNELTSIPVSFTAGKRESSA